MSQGGWNETEVSGTAMTNPARPQVPQFTDVLKARARIAPYLSPTPLRRYRRLEHVTGAEVWVKHENFQPTGSFKVRGGVNLMSQLSQDERDRGVITASTGNHGQSVAFAANMFGVPATVCAPEQSNPSKVQSMRDLGAEVILVGSRFDDSRRHCEELGQSHGYRYINPGNEPLLISGVGTYALEILEAIPDVDVVIAPVGGGSGMSGLCTVFKTLKPQVRLIAVQSSQAPSAYLSWTTGTPTDAPNNTTAEGLSTGSPFQLPQRILHGSLDEFVLVTDEELVEATALMIETTRSLVEAAGAAALAAAQKLKAQLAGKCVALICSGGNISPAQLATLTERWRA